MDRAAGPNERWLPVAGVLAALVPAVLIVTAGEMVALFTLIVVSPFAYAAWLRYAYPALPHRRVLRTVAVALTAGLTLVFLEYWMTDRARVLDVTQLVGVALAGTAGMGVALLGSATGHWLQGQPSATGEETTGESCKECPICGDCHPAGAARCARDGAPLIDLGVPRLLTGRYRLERRLGHGGMAAVYEASDATLNRRVAVKLLRQELVAQPGALDRFQAEARAAAGFNHPNVVTVFDYGPAGSRAFLVMELLTGRTLRTVLDGEDRLTPARALPLLEDMTAAVEAAHGQQWLHRDLKPENVILVDGATRDRAKVLDFGLATLMTDAAHGPLIAPSADGAVIGTPLYMSPEQLRGEEPDRSWDVWALSVIAFEMLCGAHPFAETPPSDAGYADDPAPESPWARLPTRARQFFAGALAIDRARRPSSAASLLRNLERSLDA